MAGSQPADTFPRWVGCADPQVGAIAAVEFDGLFPKPSSADYGATFQGHSPSPWNAPCVASCARAKSHAVSIGTGAPARL